MPEPDLGAAVAGAIERSVLPSVVARGGGLRVVAVEGGVVTLEARGSPGATLPILSRLDAQLRAAVPGITRVRVVEPGGPSPPGAPGEGWLSGFAASSTRRSTP